MMELLELFDGGLPVDATVRFAVSGSDWTLTFESRGGSASSGTAVNPDYARALELVLERFGTLGATLIRAYLDTDRVRDHAENDRMIAVEGMPYPVRLTGVNADEFRRKLQRAAAAMFRAPDAAPTGGNPTRRITLIVQSHTPYPDAVRTLRNGV
ncbi:MAG: hypothetical protein SFX74_00005 [Fimbriimonadaceae bacterium]|nr:hypothetical protein [Fimbriimonadaceae bacterium]